MRRIASGSYIQVALALREQMRRSADLSALVFDEATGKQVDFDLSGSAEDVSARLSKRFPSAADEAPRSPGRPRLGVVAREVTLLPQQWEWLSEQPGGASVTLRKLVDDAKRAPLSPKAQLRKLHERAYHFMSAIAGNLANFEEAARALFANDMAHFQSLIAEWPEDVRAHLSRLVTPD
jgi:hypothetical protein